MNFDSLNHHTDNCRFHSRNNASDRTWGYFPERWKLRTSVRSFMMKRRWQKQVELRLF